jgi:hypothetical protein
MNIKDPAVIKDLLSKEQLKELEDYFFPISKDAKLDDDGSRVLHGDQGPHGEILKKYTDILLPHARKIFESDTLVPSYTLFAHYRGDNASLHKHLDANACTYTLDLCLYCKTDWDLWVEGKPYKFLPGEFVAFYGEDQVHWRDAFPNPESNYYAAIFFHFVEPDHWWFHDKSYRLKRIEELAPLIDKLNNRGEYQ